MAGIRRLIGLGLAIAATAGCNGDGEEAGQSDLSDFCGPVLSRVDSFMALSSAGSRTDDRYGGTAVVGATSELAGGMNAFGTAESAAAQHQTFVHLMTLIQFDEDLQPIPYLARSWESSEDGLELTFRLRDDVFWHDGRRTTAFDVAFTFERVTDPATRFPNASLWNHYLPGPAGVEVVDSFTVKLRLERPHPGYLVPWQTVAIMPRHLLEEVPPAEMNAHPFGSLCPVGNGPFRFVSHSPDDRWVFDANPAFPAGLGGRPFLDRYVYRVIPENATLLAELLTGSIDLYVAVLPDQVPQIQGAEGVEVVTFPYRSVSFVAWNTRRPQLADPRLRRALTLATPRARMLETLRSGAGVIANSGVPPMHFGYRPGFGDSLPYDPTGAALLLEEAGWVDRDGDGTRENPGGEPFQINLKTNVSQERQEVAEVVRGALSEIGIDARLSVLDFGTLVGQITDPESRDFDGVVLGWEVGFAVDETDLFHSGSVAGPMAFAGLTDPEMDRLLDTLRTVPDSDSARPIWWAYQERVLELQPFTYLFYPHRQDGVSTRLEGVQLDLRGEWQSIRGWRIPPALRN